MSDILSRRNAALAGRYSVERQLGEGGMATATLPDFGHAEATADLPNQSIRNLSMARNRLDVAVHGIRPERMRTAFTLQHAAVRSKMLE